MFDVQNLRGVLSLEFYPQSGGTPPLVRGFDFVETNDQVLFVEGRDRAQFVE